MPSLVTFTFIHRPSARRDEAGAATAATTVVAAAMAVRRMRKFMVL
jgi:hypothetical protein